MISLEICRKKFNSNLEEDFTDDYDEIVNFLASNGYKVHKSLGHTLEQLAFEVIFIRKDIEFPGIINDPKGQQP